MGTLIFIDKNKADLLIAKGFRCVEQKSGENTLYTFLDSERLRKELQGNFAVGDYVKTDLVFL